VEADCAVGQPHLVKALLQYVEPPGGVARRVISRALAKMAAGLAKHVDGHLLHRCIDDCHGATSFTQAVENWKIET